jgi:hypothetical protein
VEIDPKYEKMAVDRLQHLTGMVPDDARALFEAMVTGAADQAAETVTGSSAPPSAMLALRAEHLYFVCLRVHRVLRQREVEVLWRVKPATAKSILTTMRATYEESVRSQFAERMRADATVEATGSAESGLSWTVRFSEPTNAEFAWSEIQRLGLDRECDYAGRTVEVPREVKRGKETMKPLDLLGLQEPGK